MPTTLRSASTTVTAPCSVFESRSIAVRASSSGLKPGASASMISAAVFIKESARLFDRPGGVQTHGDRGDHVGGDRRLDGAAEQTGSLLPGAGVGDHRGAGGGEGLEATGEERRGDPGEDI